MSNASAKLKYDPELPFVVYAPGSNEINSRFKYENEALTHRGTATWLEVTDTTPKPKIPEEAEFITWRLNDGDSVHVAWFEDSYWVYANVEVSLEELIAEIGDAPVSVLVREDD